MCRVPETEVAMAAHSHYIDHPPNIEELVIRMAAAHVVAGHGERDPGGLLHDVAQVPRQLQRAEGRLVVGARVADRCLYEQGAATCRREMDLLDTIANFLNNVILVKITHIWGLDFHFDLRTYKDRMDHN